MDDHGQAQGQPQGDAHLGVGPRPGQHLTGPAGVVEQRRGRLPHLIARAFADAGLVGGSIEDSTGDAAKPIYDFALALVGWLKGGLGHVNVVGSVIFAGMSGTAIADAAGLGTVEIKAMKDHGYDTEFAVGVTAASATLGPIIPPSLAMVIYGASSNTSVGQLFAAGVVLTGGSAKMASGSVGNLNWQAQSTLVGVTATGGDSGGAGRSAADRWIIGELQRVEAADALPQQGGDPARDSGGAAAAGGGGCGGEVGGLGVVTGGHFTHRRQAEADHADVLGHAVALDVAARRRPDERIGRRDLALDLLAEGDPVGLREELHRLVDAGQLVGGQVQRRVPAQRVDADLALGDARLHVAMQEFDRVLERDDVLIVASVSCLYGIGSVETYSAMIFDLKKGAVQDQRGT